MKTLTLAGATLALALTPVAAQAGSYKTIGLHTAPPVLTTGIEALPAVQFPHPIVHVPAPPPVVSEGGYDPGTPATGEGGSDPGSNGEEGDDPFKP